VIAYFNGLNQLVGPFGHLIRIDRLLNLKNRHQRSEFIGCLKDRAFASPQAIRVGNDLPGVTNLLEFLENLVDLVLNVIACALGQIEGSGKWGEHDLMRFLLR